MTPLVGEFVRKVLPISPLPNGKVELSLYLLPCVKILSVFVPIISNTPNILAVEMKAFNIGKSFLEEFYSLHPPIVRV